MEQQQQQQPQGAAEAAASSTNQNISNVLLPHAFVQDPAAYLASVASQPPSRYALAQLAGPVAAWFSSSAGAAAGAALVANLYLQAVSVQLQDDAAVGDVEQEMLRTQQQYEILEAVSAAASYCRDRIVISSSGILPTLAHFMLSQPNQLQQVSVEFLHCAVLGEHYRYAARLVANTWPRPNSTVSVKQVLRYYYLRGMMHLGCNDYTQAHRCFWTCLSVPAEVCSKIMMEAWKKLILVQCLLGGGTSNSSNLPKNMSNCMGRLLVSYKEAASAKSKSSRSTTMSSQQQQQTASATTAVTCYMDLVEAFNQRDKRKVEALQQEHETTFQTDGNYGLIQQCHTQLVRNQVLHLAKLYSVVSLSKLTELLELTSIEQVTTILCQSEVACDIQEDGMVVFLENSTTDDTSSTSLVDITEWMQLLEKVQRLDVNIATSAKYHSLVRKESSSSEAAKAAAVSSGPRGVEDF